MKKVFIAASVLLLATAAAIPASAQGWSFGFSSGNGYYGNGYNGNGYGGYYGNGYGYPYRRGYGGYYNPYSAYLHERRQHARLHRQLDEAHADAHDEGIYGHQDHADTHDALDEAHEQYHQNRGY